MKWPRYSLRMLLVVITVIGIWLGIEAGRARQQQDAVAAIRKLGAAVWYDYHIKPYGPSIERLFEVKPTATPLEPLWLDNAIGVDYFHNVNTANFFQPITDDDLAFVEKLPSLVTLGIGQSKVTSAGLVRLTALNRLMYLVLERSQVDDDGMKFLVHLPNLWLLNLEHTNVGDRGCEQIAHIHSLGFLILDQMPITDAGVARLAELTNLIDLDLDWASITDASVSALSQLKKLTRLDLAGTKLTASGVDQLKAALPNTQIVWYPPVDKNRQGDDR
ncbi:MAG TPA: hypothetical protein VFE46_06650 [Pirellulales bacterium]|jgi:hypothetical protein|nr:hypothetical protein [Pirellulales bacterium]